MRVDEIVKKFQEDFPELTAKISCSQHHWMLYDGDLSEISQEINFTMPKKVNPYHVEGDVWTHTMMVCQEAERLGLSKLLKYCALLHDVGKPNCRKLLDEKKYVAFYGHEPYSAFLSLDILKHYEFTEDEIIHAFKLIAMHTEPFKLDPMKLTKRLQGQNEFYKDLMKLNKADQNGRFSDNPRNNTNPELLGVVPNLYKNDFHANSPEIVVLIGLPCSGKSTERKNLLKSKNYAILSTDDILMETAEGKDYNEKWKNFDRKLGDKLMDERKNEAIKKRQDIIVDRTNLSRKSRRKFLGQIPKIYKKRAIVCLTGMEEIFRRNKERNLEEGKNIGRDVFDRMMKQFYPPFYDEFDEIEWRLN